jgi:mono/diheme cytochrome c family protein
MNQHGETDSIVEPGPANRQVVAVVSGVTVAALLVWALGWWVMWVANARLSPDPVRDARLAAEAAASAEADRLAKLGPPGPALDPHTVARGQRLYTAACVACHAPDGRGVPNMGKDLVGGRYAVQSRDADLLAMIAAGRDVSDPRNTTKMPMPARGGRADYSDANLADVVAYIRYLQDPRRVTGELPEVEVAVLDSPAEDEKPVASVPTQSVTNPATPVSTENTPIPLAVQLDPEVVKRGKRVYSSCMTCHGAKGTGVAKMGADLVHSKFVSSKSDEELVAFVKQGRQPGDPQSVMNLSMPAKGGNPALKDNQIQDVIVYIRSLQQAAADAK